MLDSVEQKQFGDEKEFVIGRERGGNETAASLDEDDSKEHFHENQVNCKDAGDDARRGKARAKNNISRVHSERFR